MPELITDSDKYTDNLLQEKDKTKVKNFITFYNAQVNEPEKYAKEKTNLDKIKANLDELLIPNADTSAILRKLDSITKLEPPTRKKSIVGGVIEKAAEAAEKAARNAYQTAKTASSKFNKSSQKDFGTVSPQSSGSTFLDERERSSSDSQDGGMSRFPSGMRPPPPPPREPVVSSQQQKPVLPPNKPTFEQVKAVSNKANSAQKLATSVTSDKPPAPVPPRRPMQQRGPIKTPPPLPRNRPGEGKASKGDERPRTPSV